jgi:hypothetical protein
MYCFIDTFCDGDFRVVYGPVGGSAHDHLWGVRSHLAGADLESRYWIPLGYARHYLYTLSS